MRYVELRGLSIGYSGHVVAEGLAAQLRTGELTCLIGRNGTGKSTLLKTVAGLLPPIGGDIMVVEDGKESPLLTQRDIAVVLTERINIQGMRVRDMVGLGRSPYTGFFGVLRERDNEIVTEAMTLAGLPPEQYAHRLINEISDGEKQKAMIAKAIA